MTVSVSPSLPVSKCMDEATFRSSLGFPYACGPVTDIFCCLVEPPVTKRPACVAVKKWRLYNHHDADSGVSTFTEQLRSCVDVYARLRHARIVPITELEGPSGCIPLLTMPFYKNGNVLDYILRYPSASIRNLQVDIATGLQFMHALDPPIAHGTLKASNVMVTDSGRACISDACINMMPMPPSWTIENAVYVRWLAPEILSSGAESDDSDTSLATLPGDVYSFSMTSVEMFTGKRPFAHIRSRVAVLLRALQGERPIRPSLDEAPQLTDSTWSILQHCWKEDPVLRPSISTVNGWLQLLVAESRSPSER